MTELADRKNDLVQRMIKEQGVDVYEGSVRYVEAVRDAGLRRAVVSSSANTREVLRVTGIEDLFEAVVDGADDRARGPQRQAGARHLPRGSARARRRAVAGGGVRGRPGRRRGGARGRFGCVVGVDRVGHADDLRAHGADVVVEDLSELLG